MAEDAMSSANMVGPKQATRLNFWIYRREPEERRPLDDVNFGSLLSRLLDEPLFGREGSLKVEAERTHEWELIFDIAITGAIHFVQGAIGQLGAQFADWLIQEFRERHSNSAPPELRASGASPIPVNLEDPTKSKSDLESLFKLASEHKVAVTMVIEPRPNP